MKIAVKLLLSFQIISFLLISNISSNAFAQLQNPISLKFLTYNIKGLPPIAADGWKNDRLPVIAQRLAERLANGTAPDFVTLQEVFTAEAKAIVPLSGYPYSAQGPNRNGTGPGGDFQKIYGSGTFILSRYPIVETGIVNYPDGVCGTWDCHANKGLMYVKIKMDGIDEPITVFDTHMQSGKRFDDVRLKQIEVLSKFVNDHRGTGIFFFGGDFNSSPDLPSFAELKKTFGAMTAGEYCSSPAATCEFGENTSPADVFSDSIDHIFYAGSAHATVTPVYVVRNFTEIFGDKTLSDHLGLEAHFLISTY